jgi:hypothetical protein
VKILTILVFIFFTNGVNAKSDSYASDFFGVSIDIPTMKANKIQEVQEIADFFLPSVDLFSANVGIQKQYFKGTMIDYNELSLSQFRKAGWRVVDAKNLLNESFWEYVGSMLGYDLHWYSRAVKKDNYVYLVTATALSSKWDSQKDILRKSVNSFKIK